MRDLPLNGNHLELLKLLGIRHLLQKDMVKRLGISKQAVSKAVKRLMSDQLLILDYASSGKQYNITAAGREVLMQAEKSTNEIGDRTSHNAASGEEKDFYKVRADATSVDLPAKRQRSPKFADRRRYHNFRFILPLTAPRPSKMGHLSGKLSGFPAVKWVSKTDMKWDQFHIGLDLGVELQTVDLELDVNYLIIRGQTFIHYSTMYEDSYEPLEAELDRVDPFIEQIEEMLRQVIPDLRFMRLPAAPRHGAKYMIYIKAEIADEGDAAAKHFYVRGLNWLKRDPYDNLRRLLMDFSDPEHIGEPEFEFVHPSKFAVDAEWVRNFKLANGVKNFEKLVKRVTPDRLGDMVVAGSDGDWDFEYEETMRKLNTGDIKDIKEISKNLVAVTANNAKGMHEQRQFASEHNRLLRIINNAAEDTGFFRKLFRRGQK